MASSPKVTYGGLKVWLDGQLVYEYTQLANFTIMIDIGELVKRKRYLFVFLIGIGLLVMLCCLIPVADYCTRAPVENAEILVSACKDPGAVDVSPDGEALWVYEKLSETHYLFNLRSGEKNPVSATAIQLWNQSSGVLKMMSPELLLRQGRLFINPPDYRPYQIISLTDGSQFSLVDIGAQIDIYSSDGTFNPNLVSYFQSAEKIYVHRQWRVVIAIAPNFRQHPEQNIVLHQAYLEPESNNGEELLIEFLDEHHLNYEIIDVDLLNKDNFSPLGNYIVRGDGIHSKDDHIILDRRAWGGNFRGWYYDESAIVVQPSADWLIQTTLMGNYFRVPQPILKVPLP